MLEAAQGGAYTWYSKKTTLIYCPGDLRVRSPNRVRWILILIGCLHGGNSQRNSSNSVSTVTWETKPETPGQHCVRCCERFPSQTLQRWDFMIGGPAYVIPVGQELLPLGAPPSISLTLTLKGQTPSTLETSMEERLQQVASSQMQQGLSKYNLCQVWARRFW